MKTLGFIGTGGMGSGMAALDGYEATGIACNVFDLITGQKKGH